MQWILNILIAIDQLGNAITGGNPDASISARVGYFANKKNIPFHNYWKVLEWVINFAFYPVDGPNHSLRTLQKDKCNKFIQGSDLAKAILGIFIIIVNIFIAIFLRIVVLVIPSWRYKIKPSKSNKD